MNKLPIVAISVGLLGFASWSAPSDARADQKISSLAGSLARLRSEVEALSNQVETKKADLRARMRSLATQKAELEIQIKREQLRLKQLAKRRTEHKQRVEQEDARRSQLKPVVGELAALLKQAIEQTLPFRRSDRLKEVDAIVKRSNDKLLQSDAAIAQLWERIEDELRLGRESGIYKQVVVLDGKQHLVEVARVGMVMLFFRTRDERYGMARRTDSGWRYEEIERKDQWLRVAALFDAFKKQIRTGFFILPQSLDSSPSSPRAKTSRGGVR